MAAPVNRFANPRENPSAQFKQVVRANAGPPPKADAAGPAELAKVGLITGQKFEISKLDPVFAKGLNGSTPVASTGFRKARSRLARL